jgi:hypothetical protein
MLSFVIVSKSDLLFSSIVSKDPPTPYAQSKYDVFSELNSTNGEV